MLLRCVKSIVDSDFKDIELIVIDDSSSDGTEKLTEADLETPLVKIIHLEEQTMMVGARNLGASHAKGQYLITIDDDNIIPPDMLGILVKALDQNPEYGILGPVIYYHSTRSLIMCGQKINMYTGKTIGFTDLEDSPIIDSDGIPNAFAIRKSVFEEVKGFDASIIQTFTEPDFAFQARKLGHKCGFVKAAKTYHDIPFEGQLTPRSLGSMYVQKAYCLMRNRTVMVARYGSIFQKIVYSMFFS